MTLERDPGSAPRASRRKASSQILIPLAWFVVLTSIFALAYNQSPLFSSNQNQYFIHGYAQAGVGNMSSDWLANTADPTPVFSYLVAATIRLFHSAIIFFVYYALLMGVYLFSLVGIVDHVFPLKNSLYKIHFLVTSIILLHSTLLRYLIIKLLGGDWPYLFEGGVAGQRLLGTVFQPSTFGVFLVLSIYLYLVGKKALAVLSAILAATFHPTYLISAAVLTAAFMIDTWVSGKKLWPAVRLGAISLAAVAPILVYTFLNFWGGDPAIASEARSILVNIRIPPHAIVADWFNATVVIKLIFVGIALYLLRRDRLFWLLLIPVIVSITLTLLQAVTRNDTLALLFPWRLSTWLVPISVCLIIGKIITLTIPRMSAVTVRVISSTGMALITVVLAAGIVRSYIEEGEWAALPVRPLEAYVAAHRGLGDIYLVPIKLYDFRMETGVPIFVDFESIPYQDAEVVEWYRRYMQALGYYQTWKCSAIPAFIGQGITHVVVPSDAPVKCPEFNEVYSDDVYRLYELVPGH